MKRLTYEIVLKIIAELSPASKSPEEADEK
jgi:hypothetical protein